MVKLDTVGRNHLYIGSCIKEKINKHINKKRITYILTTIQVLTTSQTLKILFNETLYNETEDARNKRL